MSASILARLASIEEDLANLHASRPLCCYDCGRRYARGPDLLVSAEDWERIAPHDGDGVLCPNCMHDRFAALGVAEGTVRAVFASGPFAAVRCDGCHRYEPSPTRPDGTCPIRVGVVPPDGCCEEWEAKP